MSEFLKFSCFWSFLLEAPNLTRYLKTFVYSGKMDNTFVGGYHSFNFPKAGWIILIFKHLYFVKLFVKQWEFDVTYEFFLRNKFQEWYLCYSTITCRVLLNWPHSKLVQHCADSSILANASLEDAQALSYFCTTLPPLNR